MMSSQKKTEQGRHIRNSDNKWTVVRGHILKKVTFEQRPEEGEV
jgi:hypothetical protein